MLARDPLTGYLHDVPDEWLGEDLDDGLGLPIAPLLASVVPMIPQLLGGLFGGGSHGATPAQAPQAVMSAPAPPQLIPYPVPIPIPIPVPARTWQAAYEPQPVAVAAPVVLRSPTRRRRR
jgi:hypothetical protein